MLEKATVPVAFRVRTLILAAALAATVVTLLGSAFPLNLAVESSAGHVLIDTATGVVAMLAGYIVFARFGRRGDRTELILAAALAIAAVSAFAFGAVPAASHETVTRFMTWSTVVAALLASVLIAVSPFAPQRRIVNRRAAVVSLCAFCATALAVIGVVMGALAPHLPIAIDASLSPNSPGHPRVVGNTTLLVAMAMIACLYAIAAAGFARRAIAEGEELFGWFAAAAATLAFSSLNYFLFPSRFSDWLFVGDWLRLAAAIILLIAAGREISAYQRGIAAAAVLEERRRLARELHDGLAQELAFISTQTRRLLATSDRRRIEQLALAAERALDESRSAIRALTRRLDEPLEVAVAQAAEEVAERVGIDVRLELDQGVEVPVTTREALLRIVREAVSNTARHSQASQVTVTLSHADTVSLRIADDGVGFDPRVERNGLGFGLVSMRERAQAFGGDLMIESRPGHGTEIQVVIP